MTLSICERKRPLVLAVLFLALTKLTFVGAGTSGTPDNAREDFDRAPASVESSDKDSQGRLKEAYGKLPLSFEPNRGQTDSRVEFVARGSASTLFLTPAEAVLVLQKPLPVKTHEDRFAATEVRPLAKTLGAALRMKVIGANRKVRPEGRDRFTGMTNYFRGADPERWVTNVPNYARVLYQDIYPGVDLTYYGNQQQLEYDFVVEPGASPKVIKLGFDGAKKVRVDANGDLVLQVAGGEVRQKKPYVYQETELGRQTIAARYVLRGKRTVGFEVKGYDRGRVLVIDPVFSYSTFLGGSDFDDGRSIVVDSNANAYVTGRTTSFNFPTTIDAFDSTYASSTDAFVTKMNPEGTNIVYSTFLGGNSEDSGYGIAIDSSGNAYVTGSTSSIDYPTTPGVFQPTLRGGSFPGDAFLTKLNSSGTALIYSTYLGGTSSDQSNSIDLDLSNNAYIAGFTSSSNFPTTPGAFQSSWGGGGFPFGDAFVAKFNTTGTALEFSTYLGGSNPEQASGIKVDATGHSYVAGVTSSTNFPTTPGSFQTTFGGSFGSFSNFFGDAFVTKLNPAGSALIYSTYIGGSLDEGASGIAVSASGEAVITGATTSANFPTTPGVVRVGNGGVAKTTNGGGGWAASTTGITASTILALAIDPATPDVLYAGTNAGVFKSTNGGSNWSPANSGLTDLFVKSLAIDPSTPSILFLGSNTRGVFKSTDSGGTWRGVNTGQNGQSVNTLMIDPAASSTVYAGTEQGIFKTTNGGANWSAINNGLNQSISTTSLAIDPLIPSNVYAGLSFAGVFRSTNAGANWIPTNLTQTNIRSIAIDPSTPSDLYVATLNGVLKSTDSGLNWSGVNTGLANRTVNVLKIPAASPLTVYAGTANGVFKSIDGGTTWAESGSGLAGVVVNTLAIDPATHATLYAGSNNGNIDSFVSRLNSTGTALVYSTYLGGSDFDQGNAITIDGLGNVYVVGLTDSENFPTTQGLFQTLNGFNSDGFITKLGPAGASLVYSTYLGGFSSEQCLGLTVDSTNAAFVTGSTNSQNFPVTPGAFQTTITNSFNGDGFISKINAVPSISSDLGITMTAPSSSTAGSSFTYDITVTNNGPERASSIVVSDDLPETTIFNFCTSQQAQCNSAGNSVTFTLNSLEPGASATMTIFVNVNCSLGGEIVINNTATISASSIDPNPNNNSATATTNATIPPVFLSPPNQFFQANGGNSSLSVNWAAGCNWTSTSNATWITITFSSNCCNGVVQYNVSPNTGVARSGTMTVAGETFTVNQAGACVASISTTGSTIGSGGGIGSVSVSAPVGCGWVAASNASWIQIVAGASGSGNGTVGYMADPLPGATPRVGTLTIANQTLTLTQLPMSSRADFDGDQESELGFYRNGVWGFLKSSQDYDFCCGLFFNWGGPGLPPIATDFDGDGRADLAYIVPPSGGQSQAYAILKSTTEYDVFQPLFVPAGFPALGDTAVVGDFDGDGKVDPGIWRSSQGVWIIPRSSTNYTTFLFSQWGQAGDVPIVADIDGDGRSDFGFYRNGLWGFLQSSFNYDFCCGRFFSWGGAGLQPVVGDFDGDGKTDLAHLVPPSGGQSAAYAILKSSANYDFNQAIFVPAGFPVLGDTPVVGDFDGDRKDDPGIWRSSVGVFIIPRSSTNYTTFIFSQWGQPGDVPYPSSLTQR